MKAEPVPLELKDCGLWFAKTNTGPSTSISVNATLWGIGTLAVVLPLGAPIPPSPPRLTSAQPSIMGSWDLPEAANFPELIHKRISPDSGITETWILCLWP